MWSGLRRETPFKGSNPPPPAIMTNIDTLHQLQNHIAEMERHHGEELRKLKDDYDQLEAHVRHPQGGGHSAHTLLERTQGESHPQCIVDTLDSLNFSHMHCPTGRTTRRHPFVNQIMEVDIPLGWKPLNLERYDGTTDPDEHLDAFLTQANLYTNDDVILCRVFPTSLKGATLTWCGGLPPKSIDNFDTLIEHFSVQYTTSRSHRMTSATLASLQQVDDETLKKFMDKLGTPLSKSEILTQR